MKKIKISYIGGGSKQWARVFMNDLALAEGIYGEIALYDIDIEAAYRNKKIGELINKAPNCISKWDYQVYEKIEDALKGSDFVAISILPGTFKEMQSDVHAPEEYGIYQAVGDTVGPGGILRAMRTVPIYELFAKKIEEFCPEAWVMNLTNPMSICTKTLYDVFPKIKAFGCCHEVFHAQDFLCMVLAEETGISKPKRSEIYTEASGINHFTWITSAKYKNKDILALLPNFIKKHYDDGIYEKSIAGDKPWEKDTFAYGNKVKMDLYLRYGAMGAAGDRHLVEFMNNNWYLGSKENIKYWRYSQTTVDFRIKQQKERVEETIKMANGELPIVLLKSDEEAVELIKAIMGFETKVSNVNMPNKGQMPGMPIGSIVETNCVFSNDNVIPIVSNELPIAVKNLVLRNCLDIDADYIGIKERNLEKIFSVFANEPLCSNLSISDARELFKKMILNTRNYLDEYYDIDDFLTK